MDDIDSLDVSMCRERIYGCLADRHRLKEYAERLENKIKAYNNELASRKDELQRMKLDLEKERKTTKQRDSDVIPAKEETLRAAQIRFLIEEELRKRIPKTNEHALMVSHEAAAKTDVDTVLVTYTPGNTDLRYTLSYRVDGLTTIRKMRTDCCHFWNVSDAEYLLQTVTGSKMHEDMLVGECFKSTESAMLCLVQKDTRNVRISEFIHAQCQPKSGPHAQRLTQAAKGAADTPTEEQTEDSLANLVGESFATELQRYPGLERFLTARDLRMTQHVSRLKLRDLFVYALLIFLTIWSHTARTDARGTYAMNVGQQETFAPTTGGPDTQKYDEIQNWDQAYDWLQQMATPLWGATAATYRYYNFPLGFLRIRQQRVKAASASQCQRKSTVWEGFACIAPAATDDTLSKENLGIPLSPGAGRSLDPNVFLEGADTKESSQSGAVASYSAAGYTVQYNLDNYNADTTSIANVKHTFTADMVALKHGQWLGVATRALIVSLVIYNSNYDSWIWATYVLDTPSNGRVYTSSSSHPFHSNIWETTEGMTYFYMDMVRIGITLYILFVLTRDDGARSADDDTCCKKWRRYVVTCGGILDVGTVVMVAATVTIRYMLFAGDETSAVIQQHAGVFVNRATFSRAYIDMAILEGIVVVLAFCRLLLCLTVYRQVFVVFHAVRLTVKRFVNFGLLFAPALIATVFAAHGVWGGEHFRFATFHRSALSIFEFVNGDWGTQNLKFADSLFLSIAAICMFYLLMGIFVNAFLAILVDTFAQIRISHGGTAKDDGYRWTWDQRVRWVLLPSVYNLCVSSGRKMAQLRRKCRIRRRDPMLNPKEANGQREKKNRK